MHEVDDDGYERSTDYAINVLYILGFISMGDAHSEAARLLGLLGLPNDTTMETRSFTIIEERVGPFVRKVCKEILSENLIEEARLAMNAIGTQEASNAFYLWKASLTDPTIALTVDGMPKLEASYDMAWQQKGSGRQYNSQSGHGTLMGRYSRKVIGLVIKSKLCKQCIAIAKRDPNNPPAYHVCWKNHDGSSGSMESKGCVELVVEAFDKNKVVIARLCCDDDSSIRADCQWSNADYLLNNNTTVLPMVAKKVGTKRGELQPRPDKGILPAHIPEPQFVCDPNHRRKGLTGDLIKVDTSKADDKLTMTRMDSTRIGKNFGYMARTLQHRDVSEFVDAAKAVLEHHFDNHEYCGDWCRRKTETEEQKSKGIKYYRCKEKDAKLYVLLDNKLARFVTLPKLMEMAHGLDTNMNEAFNQICTWFAPKNKVFAGSGSLTNRILLAVGINSVGVDVFFRRLFMKMGMTITPNVAHYLKVKEKKRVTRLAMIRTKAAKLEKNKSKYDKLKQHTDQAKKEFHQRQGTYRKGMNMDDPYGECFMGREGEEVDQPRPAKKRRTATGPVPKYCEFCGNKGHLTKRSKKCSEFGTVGPVAFNKWDGTLLGATAAVEDDEDDVAPPFADDEDFGVPNVDAADCGMNDSTPFDCEEDLDVFYEVGTWDDDWEEHPARRGLL
jgi:hypothetical protein